MPPLTYAQIRREKDLYGNRFADMSTEQYADLMNNLLGNEDYAAGKGNWFAQGAKAASYGVDQALRATHLPQALGEIGQAVAGDVGKQFFEGAPRMAIDMLPFMKAGRVAMGVGAGAMALNTFEKTNSPLAAGVAAATAPLFGPFSKWGGDAAVGLGSRLGMNVARTQAGAAGIGGIGLLAGDAATSMVGRGLATSLATGGVLKSGLARGVEVLGQQTGMMGANLASQALVSAAAAPTGQRWDTVKQMFTDDLGATLGAAALTQLPFAAHAGARAAYGAPAAEVRFVKDYAQTLARYDKQVYGPEREAIAQGNAQLAQRIAVTEAQTKLRTDAQKQFDGRVKELPGPGQSSDVAARSFVSERFSPEPGTVAETYNAQRLVGRVEQSLQKAIAEKNPLKVALMTRRLNKLRERAGMFTDDVLLNPAPDQRRGSGRLDYTERLNDPAPEVRIKAAMEVNGETPETLKVQVDALQDKGESPSKAAEIVATVQTERAKRAEALRVKREQDRLERETARKAVKDAAIIEDNKTFTAIVKPVDEVTNAIVNALATAAKYGSEHLTLQDSVKNAALNWYTQYGRDASKLTELQKMLDGGLAQTGNKPVDDKSRVYVSDDTPDAPVAKKGVPGIKYMSAEEANTARDAIRFAPDGNKFQWSVEKITPAATKSNPDRTPHWVISRREWASTTVQQGGKEVVDQTLTPDEWTARLDEEVGDSPDMTPQIDVDGVAKQFETQERAEESVADSADTSVGEDSGAKVVIEELLDPTKALVEQLSVAETALAGQKILGKSDPANRAEEVQRGKDRLTVAMEIMARARNGEDMATLTGNYRDLWATHKVFVNWMSNPHNLGILQKWTQKMGLVTANKGKQFLSLTGNYSAGGGFWYNVGVYANGKIGKHVLPKDGVIPVEQFRKIGRGTDQPLTNDEVALYRQLVPEAFVGDKVNVKTFYEVLPKREPVVNVEEAYGQDGKASAAKQELDLLHHNWYEQLPRPSRATLQQAVGDPENARFYLEQVFKGDDAANAARFVELSTQVNSESRNGPRATTAYNSISPFDTKKYPVVRVDVVLPLRTKAEWEKTAKLGDSVEMEVRGDKQYVKGDVKWQQDNLHENLPNTLGWAMVQFVPHPVTGETVMFVGEQQSRWGQTVRKDGMEIGKPDAFVGDPQNGGHTLLPYQHELVLKAAIREAAKRGVTKVIVSDAETAMMTEMHDAVTKPVYEGTAEQAKEVLDKNAGDPELPISLLNMLVSGRRNMSDEGGSVRLLEKKYGLKFSRKVEQEGGMRLHYDTTLPSAMAKVTGDKGTKVDMGVHKNSGNYVLVDSANNVVGSYSTIGEAKGNLLGVPGGQIKRAGSPVFRDSTGVPKTNATGTLYDISKVKMSDEGSGAQMGVSPQKVFMGERMALGELARNVGLGQEHVGELSRLVSLWDNSDIAYAQLQSGTETAGLFTQQKDGQKLVWLAANGDPAVRKLFVLAHELNGHGLFQAMREGRLDAETSSRLQAYMDHISENSPEVNSMLLRELWTTLPKRYRKDDGLQKLVNSRLTDSEEVLSNFNAIISLGLASKGRPGWISEALTWLPKPIGDAMVAFASWGRKMFEAINGLMFMRKGNWTRGIVDPTELGQMHDYVKTMHTVLRANRTREAQLEQSIRMQMVNEPKYMLSALADGSMWADGVTSAGDTLVKEFRLLEPPPEKRSIKETIGAMLSKPNRGLNHFLMPLVNYAQRYGWLRHTVVGSAEKAAKNASIENDILKEMGLVRKGMSYRADDSHPMSKVSTSPIMRKALNDITWRANTMETTVEQLVSGGDKVVRDVLNKLSPEQQTTVREAVARGEVANSHMNDMIHKEQYERLVFVTGESLMLKDSNMAWETAEAKARQIVDEVRAGQITSVDEVLPFVQKMAGRIEKQVDWFRNRPYFVSARRFGAHSIRVNKRDGTHEVLDFRTADEQQQWMVQNRDSIVKGDLTPYLLKAENKGYSVTQTALDMIKDLESGQRDEIVNELTRVGIAADAAEGIADRFSQSSYLQRELQARSVPSMSPHRKFVAGYESLDVIRQQIEYLQMVTHTLTKGIANARFEMQMRDPRTRDLPEAKSIRQAWQQNQAPDMNGTRLMQKAGYTWFMAGHLLNMLQDAVTPISGALYGNMVDDGGGVMATGKRIMTAMADAKSPKRQTAFERQMLERFKKGNRGLASFTDEGANDYLAALNAHEKLKGYDASTITKVLMRPMSAGFLHMRNFHKHFTDFGMEAGLLAAFRHFKAKGIADGVAEKEAFALQTVAMGGGKYNRPAGLWASGRLQPLSAAMSLLQGFAYNQMFTWKNFFEKALGTVPNLSKEQRVNATKAFATHSGLMMAQAGIFGIPMAAALMAIVDKVFDTNSKENIANFINENVDVVDGDIERQIAMHGFVNAFGGVDYASKAQVPGVLGFNAQNGFSFESLAGPMAGLGNTAFDSLQSLAKGDVGEAAVNMAPNNFRRLLQSWKNDWEFKRKDGSLVAETTPTDKTLYALMGLRPRSVADIVERDQWQAIDANIERNANESWKEDMVELFKEDPASARMEILKRANERQESPAAIANAVVDTLLEQQMPRDAGRRAGASERVNKAAGVQASPISEMQRLQAQQAFLQQLGLGLPATPTAFERAMQIDGIRAQNPWLSYDEAVRRVDGQSGALQSRMMRGASFGLR